jgi:hypothetical protein
VAVRSVTIAGVDTFEGDVPQAAFGVEPSGSALQPTLAAPSGA